MPFYLDAIRWVSDPGTAPLSMYRHPDMVFDLRNLPDQSAPAILGKRVLCFTPGAVPIGPEVVPIGDASASLTLARRAALKTVFALGENIVAGTVGELIPELLVLLADPTGLARWKPVAVGRDLVLRFSVGGVTYQKRCAVTDPEWRQTLAVERLAYGRWRGDVLAGRMPAGQHLKALGALALKYGVPYTDFLGGQPDEGVLVPSTVIKCNFNDSNGELSAHANDDGGSGHLQGTWAWTELGGDLDVVSNALQFTATQATARADADLSSGDHYSQAAQTGGGGTAGPLFRKDSTATLTYYAVRVASDEWLTTKVSAGTFTGIGTDTTGLTLVAGDVLKGEASGTTISRYRNGSLQNSVTDSAIGSNLRCGIWSNNTNRVMDSFEAGDLAAGLSIPVAMHQYRRQRSG